MKRLELPKNKLARLGINIALIVIWFNIYWFIDLKILTAKNLIFS